MGAAVHTREISVREISRRAGTSRSGVLDALDRFSFTREEDRPVRDWPRALRLCYVKRPTKNDAEQSVIRMMQQHRAAGLSLYQIVSTLNQAFIPTKQNGFWQANTVGEILAQV